MKISTTHPERIYFEIKWSPVNAAYMKLLGARWDPPKKQWWISKHKKDVIKLIEDKYFPEANKQAILPPPPVIEIPPMPEMPDEMRELLSKELKRPLYHYQEQGVAFMVLKKYAVNGDDMGGGKTAQAIAAVVAAGMKDKPGLVVTKGACMYNWQKEFMTVAGMKSIVLDKPSLKDTWYQYYTQMKVGVFIINYESLERFFAAKVIKKEGEAITPDSIIWRMHPLLNRPMKDLLQYMILDESHEIRNEVTVKSAIAVGMGVGKPFRWCLTGTFTVNKTFDSYTQLNFLGKTANTPEKRREFIDTWCGGGKGDGDSNSVVFNQMLRKHVYFRRNRSEFGLELPELTQQLIYCDITTQREYDMAMKDLGSYLSKVKGKTPEQVENSMKGEIMVRIQTCMNIAARGKMNDAIEYIDSLIKQRHKVVIGIMHKEIKDVLLKHYPKAWVISGAENSTQKQGNVDAFNNSETGIIIVSIIAGGTGINLQTASYVLNIEYPWQPAVYYQFLARLHRNGQKNPVLSTNLLGRGTIDEKVWEIIERKKDASDKITGNESDFKREILQSFLKS
jgi:SWI/SNF-related matrix-associated actin-dependent regulator 1 of chromatin subfamily A